MIYSAYYNSPVGWLLLEADETGITKVHFAEENERGELENACLVLKQCILELDEYFLGKREEFSVNVNASGTVFQKKVWEQLQKIPFAKTISYAQLATQLGDLKSIRAAGTANGKNPVAIIIPCHRVIGSDGSLTGYGGGLWRKKWLLDFERKRKQGELFELGEGG